MIRNYLKAAYRNLVRNKMYTLINGLGLAVGLAALFIIAVYLKHEYTFDRFFEDSERIYRVISTFKKDGSQGPYTMEDMAYMTSQNVPGIESATKIASFDRYDVRKEEQAMGRFHTLYGDSAFFDVFSLKVLAGDAKNALTRKNYIILTKDTKDKIFGNEDALNKVLSFNEQDYVVGAIMENIPENCHFNFDILISFPSLSQFFRQSNAFDYPTYFKLEKPLGSAVNQEIGSYISEVINERFKKYDVEISTELQALEDIHFGLNMSRDYAITGDKKQIYIFTVIAVFILIIAVFNFLNLFTAQSENRLKEVGVRKVLGGKRKQLIRQFIGESVLLAFLSFLIAMFLVESFLPEFSALLNVNFDLHYQSESGLLVSFFLFTLILGAVSAWYPALYVSSFNPVRIFKGNTLKGKSKNSFRTSLVILQFTLSIALITSIITLWSQVQYLKKKDVGFDRDHVVYLYGITSQINDKYESIKMELLKNPKIEAVTASMSIPAGGKSPMNLRWTEQKPEEAFDVEENRVQPGYVKTYGLKLLQGKDFSEPHAKEDIIINETAARMLGGDNLIGKEVMLWQRKCRIIGIIADYNFHSLHQKIGPLVLSHFYDLKFCISIRTQDEFDSETLGYVEDVFQRYDPDYLFNYQYIKERFANLYKKEEKLNTLILIASVLGVILSVVGLYAFVALMINKRIKEMGIRKVFGASPKAISFTILKTILGWILIATFLGWSIAYFFSTNWLNNFSYHISLKPWMFIASLFVVILLAGMAIMQKIMVISKVNPVDTLRYE